MTDQWSLAKTKIDEFLAGNPKINQPVEKIAEKLNIEKSLVVVAGVLTPFFLLLLWGNGNFAVDLVGYVYPLYASIKAIESPEKDDDTLLLTYWLIFTLFKVVEGLLGVLFSSIPYFFFMKAAFLVYCFHPKTRGAELIYKTALQPYLVPALGLEHINAKPAKKSDETTSKPQNEESSQEPSKKDD
eukprot:gene10539-11676_t